MAELATDVAAPETEAFATEALVEQETDQVDETAETEGDVDAETKQDTGVPEDIVQERVRAAIEAEKATWENEKRVESYNFQSEQAQRELSSEVWRKVDGLIGWTFSEAEKGRDLTQIMQQRKRVVVEEIVNPLIAAAFNSQYPGWQHSLNQKVAKIAPEWKPTPAQAQALAYAMSTRNAETIVDAQLEYAIEAALAARLPVALKAAQEAEKEKAKPGKAVAKEQQADAVRGSQRLPTTGGGSAAPIGLQLTNKQIEELPVSTWNSYSAEQREKILNNPKRWS